MNGRDGNSGSGGGGRGAGRGRGGPERGGSRRGGQDQGRGRGPAKAGSARSGPARSGASRSGPPRAGQHKSGSSPRDQRKERGLGGTQVEGRQAVRELLLAGRRRVYEIHLSNEVERAGIIEDIEQLAAELRVPITETSRSKLDAMSHTDAPQGIVARAAELPETTLEELCEGQEGEPPPFLLAVDGVTDPGNLGALLRIAECAGVTGVVLPRHRAVHVTPTVTKTAAGAVEFLPMALVGGLPTAIETMKAAGVWVVGLDMGGETSVHDLSVAGSGVCLVLGAEGKGLSRLVSQRCDLVASIPLHGRLASLNVASAGAVACYEVARIRAQDGA